MSNNATKPIYHPAALFIGGEWISPSGSLRLDVINFATEEVFATVAEALA